MDHQFENETSETANPPPHQSSSSSPPPPPLAPSSSSSSPPPPLSSQSPPSSPPPVVKNTSLDMLSPTSSSLLSSSSSLNSQDVANSAVSIAECSFKLRQLMDRLKDEKDGVNVDELMDGLKNAYLLLDVINNDEIRRAIITEQDEFSRVETDAVPPEVKDWLSMTFTQSNSQAALGRKSRGPRTKFRSVANCIRAGIMVDKIYRRIASSSSIVVPAKVLEYYKSIDDWSFELLSMNEVSEGHVLKLVGLELLQRYDLVNKFKINLQTLDNFLSRLELGYGKYRNPYHNSTHAADVTQTVHGVLVGSGLASWLTDLELLTALVSCMIHDFEHTGTTNNYHINTASDIAILYNDKSVLENHHLSASFRLMKDQELNPFSNLKPDDYKEFRSLMIEIVLATDMSCHFQQIKNMKSTLSTPAESVDRTKALSMIVHCADISHPAKPWGQHHRWTEMLIREFFNQGDKESSLGLPISPLCDRNNTHVPESQIGFIDFIVDPSFQVMGDMIDKMLTDTVQPQQPPQQPQQPQQHEPQQKQQQFPPTTTTTKSLSTTTTATTTSTKSTTHKIAIKTSSVNKHISKTVSPTNTSNNNSNNNNNHNNVGKHGNTKPQHLNTTSNKLSATKTTIATKHATLSPTTSTSAPAVISPSSPLIEYVKIKRPWEACLAENKQKWRERAANGWICPQQIKPESTQ